MDQILKTITVVTLALFSTGIFADDTKVTYTFEKGHVIDFLLLTRKPNSDQALNDYARAAISEARALGYKGLGGFSMPRNPTQSNYHPESLIFGSWPGDFSDREQALKELLAIVPTLYSKRLDVWSMFHMSNYEIKEDISFDVHLNKIQVLTSYWKKDPEKFADFKDSFLALVDQFGGALKLNLSDARSPFGYEYTPEFTTITEWDSQQDFDAFLAENRTMDLSAVKQVHQFYLAPPKPRS